MRSIRRASNLNVAVRVRCKAERGCESKRVDDLCKQLGLGTPY